MRISDWSSDVCSSDLMRPQTARHDDTLLLVAEWMTLLLMLLVGIAMIALAIAGTVLFLDRANQFAEPAAQAAMSVEGFALRVVLGVAGGLVLLTLGMRGRKSVGEGKSVSVRVDV